MYRPFSGLFAFSCLLLTLICATGSYAENSEPAEEFVKSFKRWDFQRAIEQFAVLPQEKQDDPEICYMVGYSLLCRNQFKAAEPYVQKAVRARCHKMLYVPSPGDLGDRIRRLKGLCPPLYKTYSQESVDFTVYGRASDWFKPIYDVMPDFLKRSQEAFGKSTSGLDFYFFERRADYDRFCSLLFQMKIPGEQQNGTGNIGVVLFCQEDGLGHVVAANNVEERRGYVLHEVGHALCHTVFGGSYLDHVPQWLNEGVADLVADPHHGDAEERFNAVLRQTAGKSPAPTYYELCNQLYDDAYVRFPVAGLMVERMFKQKDISQVGELIRQARSDKGDFESAIRTVTGFSPHGCYKEVIDAFW